MALPAAAGELSFERVASQGPSGVKTADYITSSSPDTDMSAKKLDSLLEGMGSMRAAVQAKIRELAAGARAHLRQKGIDPRQVRVRLRVRCTTKYVVAQRKTSPSSALAQSAVAATKQAEPTVVGSAVETCSVKLLMRRKKQREATQMRDFAIELPALHEQTR